MFAAGVLVPITFVSGPIGHWRIYCGIGLSWAGHMWSIGKVVRALAVETLFLLCFLRSVVLIAVSVAWLGGDTPDDIIRAHCIAT